MRYIDSFKFPGVENEEQFVNYIRRTCYTSFYPFGVFAENELRELSFSEITILYKQWLRKEHSPERYGRETESRKRYIVQQK